MWRVDVPMMKMMMTQCCDCIKQHDGKWMRWNQNMDARFKSRCTTTSTGVTHQPPQQEAMQACLQLKQAKAALATYTALRLRMHSRPTPATSRMLLQTTLRHDLASSQCAPQLLLGPAAADANESTAPRMGLFQQAATRLMAFGDATTLDDASVGLMLPHARTLWDVHAMLAWLHLPGGWLPQLSEEGEPWSSRSDWESLAARSRAATAQQVPEEPDRWAAVWESMPEDGQAWTAEIAARFLKPVWERPGDADKSDADADADAEEDSSPQSAKEVKLSAAAAKAVMVEAALMGLMSPDAREAVVQGQHLLAARMLSRGIGAHPVLLHCTPFPSACVFGVAIFPPETHNLYDDDDDDDNGLAVPWLVARRPATACFHRANPQALRLLGRRCLPTCEQATQPPPLPVPQLPMGAASRGGACCWGAAASST